MTTSTPQTRRSLIDFLRETAFDTDWVELNPVLHRFPSSAASDEQAAAMLNRAENQARVMLTPAVAKRWLTYNEGNRAKNMDHIATLARDMKKGDFLDLGDLAHFGTDEHGEPRLLNVQHRCFAVIDSGVSIPITLSWGHRLDDRMFMDLGTKRGLATMFKFMGKPYSMLTAKTARVLVNVQEKKPTHVTINPSEGSNSRSLRTFTEAMEAQPMFYDGIKVYAPALSKQKVKERRFSQGALLHEFTLMRQIDAKLADKFFIDVMEVNQQSGDALWHMNKAAGSVFTLNTQTSGDSKHCTIGQTRGLLRAAWNDLRDNTVTPDNYLITPVYNGSTKSWRKVAEKLK